MLPSEKEYVTVTGTILNNKKKKKDIERGIM